MEESQLELFLLRLLLASRRVIGRRLSRFFAAALLRAFSVTSRGRTRSIYRVSAPRVWVKAPELVKLPASWWEEAPEVSVRRLSLALDLDLRDNLQRVLYFTGAYEPELNAFFRLELRAGDVFVDGGAHIGVHSLTVARHFRSLGGGRVIAFEPSPDSAAKLRAAALVNALEVDVIEAALGRAPGRAVLFSDPDYDPADAGVRSEFGSGKPIVEAQRVAFDEWAETNRLERIDVMKLDLEGAELAALHGMRHTMRTLRPRALVIELKGDSKKQDAHDAVRELLRHYGYKTTGTVFPFGNELFRPLSKLER